VSIDGPLDAAVADKNWKVKQAAWLRVRDEFKTASDGRAECFAQFGPLLPKGVTDSNASVQCAALDAALVFAERAHGIGGEQLEALLAGLVSKCLGGPRTKAGASEVCLMLIESGLAAPVCAALAQGFGDKNVKAVCGCAETMIEALKQFGPRVVPIDNASGKWVPTLYANANGVWRSGARVCAQGAA
jgi:hypothetical protein